MTSPQFQFEKSAGAALSTQEPEMRASARETRPGMVAYGRVVQEILKWLMAAALIVGVLCEAFNAP